MSEALGSARRRAACAGFWVCTLRLQQFRWVRALRCGRTSPFLALLLCLAWLSGCSAAQRSPQLPVNVGLSPASIQEHRLVEQEVFRIRSMRRQLSLIGSQERGSEGPEVGVDWQPSAANRDAKEPRPALDKKTLAETDAALAVDAPSVEQAQGAAATKVDEEGVRDGVRASPQVALCERRCELSAAICVSAASICELAEERAAETELANTCAWARQSCEEAVQVCVACRGS